MHEKLANMFPRLNIQRNAFTKLNCVMISFITSMAVTFFLNKLFKSKEMALFLDRNSPSEEKSFWITLLT